MFIDDYGNEFKTIKDIEDFARKDFYNQDEDIFIGTLEDYFSIENILKWIFKNDKEKFLKDHKDILKKAENEYAYYYSIMHDIEEI